MMQTEVEFSSIHLEYLIQDLALSRGKYTQYLTESVAINYFELKYPKHRYLLISLSTLAYSRFLMTVSNVYLLETDKTQ